MSSGPLSSRAQADFLTTTHRISGEVQTGTRPLSDMLNDMSQSYLLVYNIYVSRLNDPGEICAHAPVAYLSKENLCLVIVQFREVRAPDRGRFTVHEYRVLATLPGFEVEGKFVGPHRLDLRSFSPTALDPFVVLTEATARIAGLSGVTFGGEAILANRARLESLCLSE
jgi:hypothetical protein